MGFWNMKRTAVVVPEYNEKSRSNLEGRLDYFAWLADTYKDFLDVIIIDDASTDGSKEELSDYVERNTPAFKAVFMSKNGNKIGAIEKAVDTAPDYIDTVLLTDFDSSIPEESMAHFDDMVDSLNSDSGLGGFALRVDGENTDTLLGYIQNLEYTLGRAFDGIAR